jgi:hypothetical protein
MIADIVNVGGARNFRAEFIRNGRQIGWYGPPQHGKARRVVGMGVDNPADFRIVGIQVQMVWQVHTGLQPVSSFAGFDLATA